MATTEPVHDTSDSDSSQATDSEAEESQGEEQEVERDALESSESSDSTESDDVSSDEQPSTPSRPAPRIVPSMLNSFVNTNASPISSTSRLPARRPATRALRSSAAVPSAAATRPAPVNTNWSRSMALLNRGMSSPIKKPARVQAPYEVPSSPLDGEEGEVIDEGVSFADDGLGRIDFLCALPSELSAYILLYSDAQSLCRARQVSKSWYSICSDNIVWRDLFYQNAGWGVKSDLLEAAAAEAMAAVDPFSTSYSRGPASPALTPFSPPATPGLAGKFAKKLTNLINDLGSMHLRPLSPAVEPSAILTPQSTPIIRRASSSAISPFAPLPSPFHGDQFNAKSTSSPKNTLDWIYLYKQRHRLEKNWDKGRCKVKILKGHGDAVYAVQKRGDMLISGSRDKLLKVWDLKTDTCIHNLEGHTASVLCLQFDETLLVSGSSDTTIMVWDPVTWTHTMTLRGHTLGVLSLAFNDKWIVSCSKDLSVRVWERSTGTIYRVLKSHAGPVNAVRLNGNKLISASGDSFLKLWDVETGEVERVFAGHERGLACVAWSGDRICSGSNDSTIRVWDAKTGECLHMLEGHEDLVRGLCFDDSKNRMVSVSYDKSVRLWNTKEGKMLKSFAKGQTNYVFGVTMDCSKIITGAHDSHIVIYDFARGIDVSAFV